MSFRLFVNDVSSTRHAAAIAVCAALFGFVHSFGDKPGMSSARPASPQTRPSPKAIETDDALVVKFRSIAEEWAENAKKFAPKMHLVETQHFLIFSAWEKNQDKGMSDAIENMYKALCKQFDVDVKDQYWAGKLPIYVMATKKQFASFTNDIDHVKRPDSAGYCGGSSSGFTYIVANEITKLDWFYELIIHESTHAFLNRYKTNKLPPVWVHEGLAEYMAAALVPNSVARERFASATRIAISQKKDVSAIFKGVKGAFEYGIAQSVTRYLILKDTKAYLKFIDLLKEGKSDDDALQEAYKLTKEQLVAEWTKAAAAGAIR